MCGIAGIIDFRGHPVSDDLLAAMQQALRHRGPDDTGRWSHRAEGFAVGFAHTRLAVLDPSPLGRQPMLDPTGRWAVCYNGELYNFPDLQADFPPRRSRCDTEVVLNACIALGPAALNRFDAMWALAFVDTAERRGHLSRDPVGIKPLYYTSQNQQLIFASELAALRALPGLDWSLDPRALQLYLLLGFIPHPWTIYRQVRKLPPGHRLDFDRDGPREPLRYHAWPAPADPPPCYADACERIRLGIEHAVRRQRLSDVPIGAFLSGGLDSSIITACLARAGGPPPRTFCVSFPDHPRYNEGPDAARFARQIGADHQDIPLGFRDILAAVPTVLDHLGEPFGDSSLLPAWLVSGATRRSVTVALSGDGGDELFAGYYRYAAHHHLARYRRLPGLLRRGLIEPILARLPEARTSRRLDRLRQLRKLIRGDHPDPLDRHAAWARHADDELIRRLLGESADEAGPQLRQLYQEGIRDWRDTVPADPLETAVLADLAVTLPGDMLAKVDTASMAHGLEVRVPLLSRDLVAMVSTLPIDYRIQGTRTKRILRDAFADVLPAELLRRPKKGFEVPVGEFLRHELRDMFQDVVRPDLLDTLGIDAAAVQTTFAAHQGRRADHTELLWSLLVLCWWHHRQPSRHPSSV